MEALYTLFRLGGLEDLEPGEVCRFDETPVGALAVVNIDGQLRATSDLCPHATASLSEGFVEGEWLICPVHFAEFHTATGEVRNAPPGCPRVATYDIQREGVAALLVVPVAANAPQSNE